MYIYLYLQIKILIVNKVVELWHMLIYCQTHTTVYSNRTTVCTTLLDRSKTVAVTLCAERMPSRITYRDASLVGSCGCKNHDDNIAIHYAFSYSSLMSYCFRTSRLKLDRTFASTSGNPRTCLLAACYSTLQLTLCHLCFMQPRYSLYSWNYRSMRLKHNVNM